MIPKYRLYIFTVLYLFFCASSTFAQTNYYFDKVTVGGEIGNWMPNNLDYSNTLLTLNRKKESIYTAIYFQVPINKYFAFRLTGGYYYYKHASESEENPVEKSITIFPILLDLKYFLLNDMKISPYVSYGASANFGFEYANYSSIFGCNFDHFTFGANFGTGIDFLITRHLSVGFEFRYHYLEFAEKFIFTENYSGTKITLAICYLF